MPRKWPVACYAELIMEFCLYLGTRERKKSERVKRMEAKNILPNEKLRFLFEFQMWVPKALALYFGANERKLLLVLQRPGPCMLTQSTDVLC